MQRDATRMRAGRPFVFTALRHGKGVEAVLDHIRTMGGL
jgi:urease accessory protein